MALVTKKHRDRIHAFFDGFLVAVRKKQRIAVKRLQKMLGLQIWIRTVFRIARQFLTSVCDILRVSIHSKYFYPNQYPGLVSRAVRDLAFWRRFASGTSAATFDYLLGRLPLSKHKLYSDACSSYGMAGVLLFEQGRDRTQNIQGLFWQLSWQEWKEIFRGTLLFEHDLKINAAEFLALLITCETFSEYCSSRLTYLGVDNVSARS